MEKKLRVAFLHWRKRNCLKLFVEIKTALIFLVDNRYQEKGSVILKNSRHCLIIPSLTVEKE